MKRIFQVNLLAALLVLGFAGVRPGPSAVTRPRRIGMRGEAWLRGRSARRARRWSASEVSAPAARYNRRLSPGRRHR